MESTAYKVNFGFTRETFPLGTHMCYIYDDEAERKMVIEKYLQSGLAAREKVIALLDVETEADIDDCMNDLGLSVDQQRKTGQLVIKNQMEAYCPDGRFEMQGMLERLRGIYNLGMGEGYAAVRATGEPSWIHHGVPGAEQWLEYESELNNLALSYPYSGLLCRFDAKMYGGALLYDVLSVHPLMVVKGQVVRNPYYMTTEELRFRGRI
ncbi:MAG: MEDS domain-containing protein [Candidatus Magnetominusculus sp. LBB02]|nr:MEDS domain-containing protein [Candidatus Magnetominusculus sp. LBB02]